MLCYLDNLKLENRTEVPTPLDQRLEKTVGKIKAFVLDGKGWLQLFYWLFSEDHQTIAAYGIHTYIAERSNIDIAESARIWKISRYHPIVDGGINLDTIQPIQTFLKEIARKHEKKETVQEDFWASNLQSLEERFLQAVQFWANRKCFLVD